MVFTSLLTLLAVDKMGVDGLIDHIRLKVSIPASTVGGHIESLANKPSDLNLIKVKEMIMTEALKRLYEAMGWEFHDTVTDLVLKDPEATDE